MWLNSLPVPAFSGSYCTPESITRCFVFAHVPRQKTSSSFAARIKFKTLMLAYKTTTGLAPTYFHSLLQTNIPSRSLRSTSERCLVVPSQRGSKSLSRTISSTIPDWWNEAPPPPPPPGMLDPCQSSSNNWKIISFNSTWLHHKK